jgi:hypothetical protein
MPEHRRKFSPQFKAEAVQMVISTGKPIAVVAVAMSSAAAAIYCGRGWPGSVRQPSPTGQWAGRIVARVSRRP